MAESTLYDTGSPSIEVRVYRHDALFARELCESESEAAAVVERWSAEGDFTFLVDDLTFHHAPGDVLAPEPPDLVDDDYPIASSELPARGVE